MTRRTTYHVAGGSLLIEARDAWSAEAIDALFPGWYLTPDLEAGDGDSAPAIVVGSGAAPAPIPAGLSAFDVAGGGTCYTDGRTSYIDIDRSIVAIGLPDRAAVEVWIDGPLPLESPALTRLVTYALSAALRQRRRFELHSAAVIDPESGAGVLIAGPSGSGKSTMAVHLASAGWPFLTDDVLLLGAEPDGVTAWPLRRRFAITPETYAASGFLQARTALDDLEIQEGKRPFAPHEVFAGGFRDRCQPGVLLFPELTGDSPHRGRPARHERHDGAADPHEPVVLLRPRDGAAAPGRAGAAGAADRRLRRPRRPRSARALGVGRRRRRLRARGAGSMTTVPARASAPDYGPRRLTVELTNVCNLHCSYCLRDDDALHRQPARYLPVDLFARIAREAQQAMGIEQVAFTGGEPTLHRDFGAILATVADLSLSCSFVTNGWHFERVWPLLVEHRRAITHVSFSLDGATREAHDGWRGRGSFDRVVQAFTRCWAAGFPFKVKVTLRRDTAAELERLAIFAARMGAAGLSFAHVMPTSATVDRRLGAHRRRARRRRARDRHARPAPEDADHPRRRLPQHGARGAVLAAGGRQRQRRLPRPAHAVLQPVGLPRRPGRGRRRRRSRPRAVRRRAAAAAPPGRRSGGPAAGGAGSARARGRGGRPGYRLAVPVLPGHTRQDAVDDRGDEGNSVMSKTVHTASDRLRLSRTITSSTPTWTARKACWST